MHIDAYGLTCCGLSLMASCGLRGVRPTHREIVKNEMLSVISGMCGEVLIHLPHRFHEANMEPVQSFKPLAEVACQRAGMQICPSENNQ